MEEKGCIVLTGGGTAGHVMPNFALVSGLQDAGYSVTYIGSKNGMEKALVEEAGLPYIGIRAGKLRRYFSWENIKDAFRVLGGYSDAKKELRKLRPVMVFSKGGFVTVPVVYAAKKLKIPVVLHESDYSPGLANKMGIRVAEKVLVNFEDTLPMAGGKGITTGLPIRSELLTGNAEAGRKFCGFDGKKPILLVMGGSSGAQAINEAVAASLPALLEKFDILHQTGDGKGLDIPEQEGYQQITFLREELADVLAAADIALSRSGANAVFEFLACRLPALYIPLPLSASRGDQIQNAAYMQKHGYAAVLDQDELKNADALPKALFALYDQRQQCIEAMEAAPQADGTAMVLKEILAVANANRIEGNA